MSISLDQIFPVSQPEQYKAHLATWNGDSQPLDVFVRDRSEWKQWNTWRSTRDDFNRPYIFALIDFYPEPDTWLFGGVYRVLSRSNENKAHSYEVELADDGKEFIGRLKVKLPRPGRARAVKLEKYIGEMTVAELLKRPYAGERFAGFENICHGFNELEHIFRTSKRDWKASLESIKGVYLVVDKSNGKSYVGSAYGENGIWSRWKCYMETGHGWNDELTKLIKEKGIGYARKNFQFVLLEYMPARADKSAVLERESFWKEALLSRRDEYGYNQN